MCGCVVGVGCVGLATLLPCHTVECCCCGHNRMPYQVAKTAGPNLPSFHYMTALSRINVTRQLGCNNGRVSAHTSGYVRGAGYILLNP